MIFSNFSQQDLPSLIASILILLFMISRLAGGGMKFSKIAKYTAIWGLFGLLIIIIYSYRFDFIDLKQRIFSELNPSKPSIDKENKIIINIYFDYSSFIFISHFKCLTHIICFVDLYHHMNCVDNV